MHVTSYPNVCCFCIYRIHNDVSSTLPAISKAKTVAGLKRNIGSERDSSFLSRPIITITKAKIIVISCSISRASVEKRLLLTRI